MRKRRGGWEAGSGEEEEGWRSWWRKRMRRWWQWQWRRSTTNVQQATSGELHATHVAGGMEGRGSGF